MSSANIPAAPSAGFRAYLPLLFPALLLFVLPFSHVTALRSIGLAGVCVSALFVHYRHANPPLPLKAALAFWALAAGASLLTAIDAEYSFREIRRDVIYSILVFFAFFTLTRDVHALRLWRHVTVACTIVISLCAIVPYLGAGHWLIGYQNAIGEFSTFLVTVLPLLLSGLIGGVSERSAGGKFLVFGAIALALAAGTLGKSRALWLVVAAVFLAAGILWWLQAKNNRHRLFILMLGAAVGAGGMAVFVSQQKGIDVLHSSDRAPIYSFAADNIIRQPFYGSGFGREANREAYRQQFPNHRVLHSHSTVLSYAEQMGIWGVIALAWLFAAPAGLFRRDWQSTDAALSAIGACGLTLLVAVLLKNVTDMFFTGHLLLLFWAHVGILLGAAARMRGAAHEARPINESSTSRP